MQHRPGDRAVDSIHTQRTQPALPGMTLSTTPIPGILPSPRPLQHSSASQWRKKQNTGVLQLLGLGVLLEVLYLMLYPLLANMASTPDTIVKHAIPGVFPWVTAFYWTTTPLFSWLFVAAWLKPTTDTGRANLVLLILVLACLLALLAVRLGRRLARERWTNGRDKRIFWTMLLLTGTFSITMLCIPIGLNALSQDMLLYGLYGRIVVVYHFNPYMSTPSLFSQDVLQGLLKARDTTPYGPVWTDISLLITVFARNSIASMLLGFRLIGLIAHLVSTVLIWAVLTRLKPEMRLPLTLLYAWNPLVLLLGICYTHLEMLIVLFLLLAGFFFQRNASTLGWVFVLLTALVNPLYLLLLPFFLHMMIKDARILAGTERFLRWLSIACISGLVVVLAYVPYWQDWGLGGLGASLHHSFLPDNAVNSLNATLLHLPLKLPSTFGWLTASQHWAMFALAIVACIFLFGLWLADTLELVFLFSSWLLLTLAILMPVYWPWYIIPPLMLAICCTSARTMLLALVLAAGALISLYCWLLPSPWMGQALVTIGLPLLLWGWALFFDSTWRMTHAKEEEQAEQHKSKERRPSLSRPPWISRPPL